MSALLVALSVTSSWAISIDLENFGKTLSSKGWSKNRTATYSIDNRKYRTHVPTLTRNIDGGSFVSVRIDHLSAIRPDATCYIELTFAPEGYVGASQLRVNMNGHQLTTGQVLIETDSFDLGEEGFVYDWRSAHTKMVLELFSKLDSEFARVEGKTKDTGRRDLWGRFNNSKLQTSDISAALRHNLNMLLTNIGDSPVSYSAKAAVVAAPKRAPKIEESGIVNMPEQPVEEE